MNALKRFLCFSILIGLTLVIGCSPSTENNPGEVPAASGDQDNAPADQTPATDTASTTMAEEFVDPPQPEPTEQGGGTGSAIGKVFRKVQENQQ